MSSSSSIYKILRMVRLFSAIGRGDKRYPKRVAKSWAIAKATGKWRNR